MLVEQTISQQILDQLPNGLLIVNGENIVVFANVVAQRQLGEGLIGEVCQLPYSTKQTVDCSLVNGEGETAVFEITTTPTNWQQAPAHLLTLHDITKYERLAAHTRYVSLLGDITRAAISNLAQQELFQMLADRLGELHQADGCFLTLWDEAQQTAVLAASFGPLKDLYPQLFANNILMRLVGGEQEPVVIDNMQTSRYFAHNQTTKLPIRSLLLLPLTLDKQHLGVIVLLFKKKRPFTEPALAQAQQAAEQTTLVLAKEKLLAETEQRRLDLERLARASSDLRASRHVADMLPLILQTADLDSQTLSIIFLQHPQQETFFVAACHPTNEAWDTHIVADAAILAHILRRKRPYLTQRLADDPLTSALIPDFEPLHAATSNIFLPLLADGTELMGVIYIGLLARHDFTDREIQMLTAVTEIAVNAFQRTYLLQTLENHVQQRTQELASANQKLRQLDRLRAKFVTDMSHELRTPVTTFQLYLDLIERAQPERRERYFAILRTQTERLARLIEKALTLSRFDISLEAVAFELIDFNELVKTAVQTYQPSAEANQLMLTFHPSPQLPHLSGSHPHLLTLVSELLDNAIHYSTPKGAIVVSTQHHPATNHMQLTIEDRGVGVDAAELDHLFERFYRGNNTVQLGIPGTGLGLAIVQEIVKLHGGQVEMNRREGGGTAVLVWLPLSLST